jgi:hypothetical protein
MEQFNEFTLYQPASIVGGALIKTYCRFELCDAYDTENDRTVIISE